MGYKPVLCPFCLRYACDDRQVHAPMARFREAAWRKVVARAVDKAFREAAQPGR
jgi:hypothetical protein